MVLNFKTNSVLINGNTKQADGSDLVALAGIYNGTPGTNDDFIVRLELQLTGSVNIETGETTVFGNLVGVYTVQDELAAGTYQAIQVSGFHDGRI
jgi:hypothetical protein